MFLLVSPGGRRSTHFGLHLRFCQDKDLSSERNLVIESGWPVELWWHKGPKNKRVCGMQVCGLRVTAAVVAGAEYRMPVRWQAKISRECFGGWLVGREAVIGVEGKFDANGGRVSAAVEIYGRSGFSISSNAADHSAAS